MRAFGVMKPLSKKAQQALATKEAWRKSCFDSTYFTWAHADLQRLDEAEGMYRRHLAGACTPMDLEEAQLKLDAIQVLIANALSRRP